MQTPVNLGSINDSCVCELAYDDTERFPVMRITEYREDCLQHGYMFHVTLASDLRSE